MGKTSKQAQKPHKHLTSPQHILWKVETGVLHWQESLLPPSLREDPQPVNCWLQDCLHHLLALLMMYKSSLLFLWL